MATRVFHEGFESGTGAWANSGIYDRATAVTVGADSTGPHSGSYCLEGNWNGTSDYLTGDWRKTLELTTWDYTNEMFLRMWTRLDGNVALNNGMKIMRLGSGGQQYYNAVDMSQPLATEPLFHYFETMNYVAGPLQYGGTGYGNGAWHKLEIYIKHNTPSFTDGIVRVWVDGTQIINNAACTSVATGESWRPLILVSNWSSTPPADALNNIYFDDVEIFSDATSGTATTGNMSDASIEASGDSPTPSPATSGIGRRINIGVWR